MANENDGKIKYGVEGISNSNDFPISFSIIQLVRFHRSIAAEALRNLGLFLGQELLLMQLWEKDCQPQNTLGEVLGINHSTVAKSVKRLEESGLVYRERSTADKRVTNVCLTTKGIELKEAVLQVWNNVENRMTSNLSIEEQQQLLKLIHKIL